MVLVGGSAWLFVGVGGSCPCHSVYIEMVGGSVVGGSTPAVNNITQGGVVVGGKGYVDTNHPWSGVHGVWPLGGNYNGAENEVIDYSPNEFHGFAGHGNGDNVPEPSEDGIFCSTSSEFLGLEWITLPQDSLSPTQDFSISCWVKLDSTHLFTPRVLFSRGFTTNDGEEYVFTLGYSWIHHVWAQIQLVDDETVYFETFTTTTIPDNRWTHCAASWVPRGSLRVWVNGSNEGSIQTPQIATVDATNGNFIGRWNGGAMPIGNLQEVRLYPEAKESEFWTAEYENACKPGFYLVGKTESTVIEA